MNNLFNLLYDYNSGSRSAPVWRENIVQKGDITDEQNAMA